MSTLSPKIIVLMYHRIKEPDTNPWNICVSPHHFAEQLRYLKQHVPVVSTNELITQLKKDRITENSVCISFDDGYADNVVEALPILSAEQCPATFFIATAFIGSRQPYWWDELEMICLHSKQLPADVHLRIYDKTHHFFFEQELGQEQWQKHTAWQWFETPPTKRCGSFLRLWKLLRPLPIHEINEQMKTIRGWSDTHYSSRLPMTKEQLKYLAEHKAATIGLHTHTHIDLHSKSVDEQAADIAQGKMVLKDQFTIDANLLAYPYGRFDSNSVSVVNELNLAGAFTTEELPVTAGSNYRKLGRHGAGNWNYEQFGEQIRRWFSEA